MLTMERLDEGQRIAWMHEARGGYGYVAPVPAYVVKVNAKTVTIDALLRSGGLERTRVKPESIQTEGRNMDYINRSLDEYERGR